MNEFDSFIKWWFVDHWFWSTLITPQITFAYACWKGLVIRAIVSFLCLGAWSQSSRGHHG